MKSHNNVPARTAFCILALIASTFLSCQKLMAGSSRAAEILDSMPHAKQIGQVALSPDGTRLAYFAGHQLTIAGVDGSQPHVVSVQGDLALRDVSWSVDSKQIAFIADLAGETPVSQVWTAAADGSGLAKHTEMQGYVSTLRFAPDGSRLALLFIEGLPRIAGPLQPMLPLAGEIGEKIFEQRIATIELSTGQLRQMTPDDVYVYEYDWTPDGHSWTAIAAHGDGDANWYVARLYRVSAENGELHEIYKPKLQIAAPRVSPDGKVVAFIEGLMSDEGSTGGDVFMVALSGGSARNLTPDIKASPSNIAWAGSGRIVFAEDLDGSSGFGAVDVATGKVEQIWQGEEIARTGDEGWISAPEGGKVTTAIERESSRAPGEVWAGPIGEWKQVTHLNEGVSATWGEMRRVHWISGGLRIQGWLMLPKEVVPGTKYPLIVDVHGGPSSACMPRWDERLMTAESRMGYFALCPNPRGSYGQGERFTQGNVKDFGGGDFRDIMAGVDAIAKEYPIDGRRIGIWGHSYGGYMTMWAETQTHRFVAAVAGAGLSDWLSYYGVNDIDQWMIPFFGASVYDDPAVYAKSDPMHFVKAVKTPTLILVGDRDGEVPMEQSVEWWHALKTMHVPAKLVVYANEGHVFFKPADARDYSLRTLDWFEQWFEKAK